ncbi:MAG: hypothetical protein E5X35_11660 [Mesorhizobium sp.]|uniref:hypothetical protein n=1 Tax=unclassified Mesorhizobium TaxID=325217 RepID=UPI000FCB7883|nr:MULTISPECIES: hypothetical protein [unclassified Mesorhizobium]RUV65195.1 hypothetical protein EOA85_00080 [Mesorhizobium sp. M5C.F.Ca.IN.020.29.1.1]TIM87635.1 MAG: hypothetical protein E5Y50_11405 [Mesorhizobium sp.]TIR33314.1 MAG: hypothetical protein E5X35_11660 [Mesorhizobium sp.]
MSDWFKRARIAWIAETVEIFGFINREHIQAKFGVSTPQASYDLRDAMQAQPGRIVYNKSTKRFEKADERILTGAEQKAQGARCGCLGADDYCVCQNVPDAITKHERAAQVQP